MISSMRDQLDALEARLDQFSQNLEVEEVEEAPIDIDIDDVLVDISVVESAVESEPEVAEDDVTDDLPDDDLPFVEEPVAEEEKCEPVMEMLIDAAAANARPAVIDAMAAKEAWRTAIPGSPVKDIRSAISLHDRIIFINCLFDEDPMFFQEVLTAINAMSSIDEAVAYLSEKRPEWDMNSDEVYRFMMAVRRRIQ
ncbi:MAG: hypothetical protein IKY95_02550 [Bacteroidales bacterium]|nr:hypothetical protein [Bacteroidales bacterium]